MQTITIVLDGMQVSGFAGMTILDVARETGVKVPTLCYDSSLSASGACRLCVVEDQSTGALVESCTTPIKAGMRIITSSPRVTARRISIVQLMLSSHPDSCETCDKDNRCQLRRIAADMGIGRLRSRKSHLRDTFEQVTPFVRRNISKCILCGKCIRVDQELVVQCAVNYGDRGFIARPAGLNDPTLVRSQCNLCGTCIAHCPVGALAETEKTHHGGADASIETTCAFCGCGCSIRLEVKGNRVIGVTPVESGPVNRGALCIRGSYGYEHVYAADRLTHPMVKTVNGFRKVSWEEALGRVASELSATVTAHGADSLGVLGSTKCTNEENYVLQRLTRTVFKTNNIDNGSRLYAQASLSGLGRTAGYPGSTLPLGEIEKASVIMVVGTDPYAYAPAVGYAIKRAVRFNGAKLILIDPRKTALAPYSHVWLRPKVGTDLDLLNAIARTLVQENLYDREFVERCTENFDELRRHLNAWSVDSAAAISGVPAKDLEAASRLIGGVEPVSIIFGDGICRWAGGAECVTALANLAMLTGNVGQQRGGLLALKMDNNAQGACDMGTLPDLLPGYQGVEDSRSSTAFERLWGERLSKAPGLTAPQMIEAAEEGRLKAMLIVGENPAAEFPNSSAVRSALASLDFLAVSDMFLTETAKLATVVLPAASFAEKEGTFTNFEGRVQPVRKATSSPGQSLPDLAIILRLAERMGHKMPYSSAEQVMDEIREVVTFYGDSASVDVETDEADARFRLKSRFSGMKRLHGGVFPAGFGRFHPASTKEMGEARREAYPLTLLTGTTLAHSGSGSRTQRAPHLKKFSPHCWIEVSPSDAEQFGLISGDRVLVASPYGEVSTYVEVTEAVPGGMVFMPMSFPEAPVNELLGRSVDANAGAARVERCSVRLEKVESNAQRQREAEALRAAGS